ncbi:hypothetical protein ALC152_01280 [Arcobacter sp. 15-2]|uniref:hypothetical protein n=1 Tax=Arcobacter sp. 15-2 TaxID=3374109 RepID=UPI00399CEC35
MIKKKITTLNNILKNKANSVLSDTNDFLNIAKKTLLQPKENLLYIKHKNEEIKEIISNSNTKIEEQRVAVNTQLKLFAQVKQEIIDTSIAEYSSLMAQLENFDYEEKEIAKIDFCEISSIVWKKKFTVINKRAEIDKYYDEVLNYSYTIDKEIIKLQQLSQFITHIVKTMQKFQIAVTQLNKQTINIINNIGTNYKKYTKEQQNIICKHTRYIDELFFIMNTSIINKDESFNNEMILILQKANEFLDKSETIVFKEFKKKNYIYYYIALGIIVLGFVFYQLFLSYKT